MTASGGRTHQQGEMQQDERRLRQPAADMDAPDASSFDHVAPAPPGALNAATLLHIQATRGNRAAQRYLQRQAGGNTSAQADESLSEQVRAASTGGSPLEVGVQSRLEQGLGADLSDVRVHTDSTADRLTKSVDAVAFTSGSDIFFRSGTYDPASAAGQHLIAHEAAHTMQQAAGPVAGDPHPGGVSISNPRDQYERAAESAASTALQRMAVSDDEPSPAPPMPVQRSIRGSVARPWLQRQAAAAPAAPGQAEEEDEEQKPAAPAVPAAEQEAAPLPAATDTGGAVERGPEPPNPTPPSAPEVVLDQAEQGGESTSANQTQMRTDDAVEPSPRAAKGFVTGGGAGGGALEQKMAEQAPKPEEEDEEEVAVQRWSTDGENEGFIDLWPSNLIVKMRNPPDLVMSKYDSGWTPEVLFNHEYSWDTHSGPSGHFYLNGQEAGNWDDENEWVKLGAVAKAMLQTGGPDTYTPTVNNAEATFITRPDFHTDERTVRVDKKFNTYGSGLAAAPVATMTQDAYDESNKIIVAEQGGAASGKGAQTVNAQITQSVAKTVSTTATNTFGHTTSTGVETSAGVEGSKGGEKSGGDGKDTWGLKASLGRKWTDTEQEQTQKALAEAYAEMETAATSYSVPFTIPAGVPAVVMIVPVTRKVTASFQVVSSDDSGKVDTTAGSKPETRVTEAHVPKGYVGVYGYDTQYVGALEKHYENCRTLRQQAQGLKGAKLEAKKAEIRQAITKFSSENQPSIERARADAQDRLKSMQPAAGGQVAQSPVSADNIMRWHTGIDEIWKFAAGVSD
jgi:hypothetical protein